MSDTVQICNRALQKLGAARITSLTQDSPNARACNVAYDTLRQAELRKNPWLFAITRAQLAASATTPAFGRGYSYPLPSDFIRVLAPYPEVNYNDLDWIIENGQVYTNDTAPLNFRYVFDVTDPNQMDRLFLEALSTSMAYELCEQITQSNTKKAALKVDYKDIISEAKKVNALEQVQPEAPADTYLTARY